MRRHPGLGSISGSIQRHSLTFSGASAGSSFPWLRVSGYQSQRFIFHLAADTDAKISLQKVKSCVFTVEKGSKVRQDGVSIFLSLTFASRPPFPPVPVLPRP